MTALSIEQILVQDPHIVAIHPPLYTQIPKINLDYFDPETKDKVEKMTKIVTDYLSYPLIEDNFGANHPQRREWRKEMEQTYGELFSSYYSKNKLRGNVYGYTIQALRFLCLKAIGETKEELTRTVIDITHCLPDNYDLLSVTEKIQTMRLVEQKVYDYLTSIQILPI